MIIGIAGPIGLNMLEYDFGDATLPDRNVFPLPTHLVNSLLRRGHKVIVYTNSGSIDEPFVLEHDQLTVCVAPTRPKPGRAFFDIEIEGLKKLMQQYPADVVHAFWTYEYALASLKSGLPTIVGIHDVASRILFTQFDIFRVVRWYMNCQAIRQSKYLAANSAYTFHQLSKRTQAKTRIINNFFSKEIEQAAQVPTVKQNHIVSVTMGFTKRKGIPLALHAFSKLRKQFPTLEYHLVGAEMEPGGEAQQYARKNGLDDGIRYHGILPYDQLLKIVAEAKVFLHPSVEESFGMAPLEAMVLGTAVVGGQKSGFIPYLLDHGNVGLLCDIYSSESMARAVRRLLVDETLMMEMTKRAQEFAFANFSEEVIVQQHLDFIKHVYEHQLQLLNQNGEVKAEEIGALEA